jgi:hypothetical protein
MAASTKAMAWGQDSRRPAKPMMVDQFRKDEKDTGGKKQSGLQNRALAQGGSA